VWELQCITAYLKIPLQIYRIEHENETNDIYLRPCTHLHLPPWNEDLNMIHVVIDFDQNTGCGHFSRLLSQAQWDAINAWESASNCSSDHATSSSSCLSSFSLASKKSGKASEPDGVVEHESNTVPSKTEPEPSIPSDVELDSLSEASDGWDPSDVFVDVTKKFVTSEDRDLQRIDDIAQLLRCNPLAPCDPEDVLLRFCMNAVMKM